jgi:tRNA G18 (ribose-2'-O)-methylase SpoU
MPEFRIQCVDDPRIVPYRNLPCRGLAGQGGRFIAEGALLVQRLLASDYCTESVFVDEGRVDAFRAQLPAATAVYVASHELMRQVVGFKFHRGILACGRCGPPLPLGDVVSDDRRPFLAVVCVDIQDPENLGGIARNCAAFGADAVVVAGRSTSPFSRRVLRVSMGAVLKLPLVQTRNLDRDLDTLRSEGRAELAAAVLDPSAASLESVERPERLALLFGNEADGLAARWTARCDRKITIPMSGGTDSLNVAVASGVFLYHFTRRNWPP